MDLRGVDLNLLLALEALLRERNVTQAAKQLSVGQPAMSASLGRLRRHYGDQLLIRDGKALVPTPVAEALYPLAREALGAVDAVFNRAQGFNPAVDRRTFTVVASDYVTLLLLRPLVARLTTEAPLQRINVVPPQTDYIDQLRTGKVDLLVIPAEMMSPSITIPHRHLFTDRYVLVADAANDAVQPGLTTEQFSSHPYVAFSGGPHPSFADAQLDALGITRRVEMSTQSLVTIPFLVTDTPLIAFAHERLARHVAERIPLKILEPPFALRSIDETLYWNPRHSTDPAHAWLRTQIVNQATPLDIDHVDVDHRS